MGLFPEWSMQTHMHARLTCTFGKACWCDTPLQWSWDINPPSKASDFEFLSRCQSQLQALNIIRARDSAVKGARMLMHMQMKPPVCAHVVFAWRSLPCIFHALPFARFPSCDWCPFCSFYSLPRVLLEGPPFFFPLNFQALNTSHIIGCRCFPTSRPLKEARTQATEKVV